MNYIDGYLVAVPAGNKEKYRTMATKMAALFKDYGAVRVVETWGDDVARGKLNDFFTAVHAKEGEVVVFSWVEYPSKAVRDAAVKKMMNDPRMKEIGESEGEDIFDGRRMIFGGFQSILDQK